MTVEGFENLFQEAVSKKHARCCDINNRNALLGGNCFEEIPAMWRACGDARAFAGRIARVENEYGNVFLHCRKDRRWMQNLRAEISKLGGFIEADDFDPMSVRAKVRVGGHHAIYVGP